MSELVKMLSAQSAPVEFSARPQRSIEALRECIGRGYVHVKFPTTRGGTELGITIDRERSDLAAADNRGETGTIRVVGDLVLDYVPVTCIADLDLSTLNGTGQLVIRAEAPPSRS